jgi:nucleoside-diphosphate-sugar epimerase
MDLAGRTIAVTGATGFLGSHLALELLARGAKVRCVVRSPEKAAWLVEKGCTVARADLAERDALAEAFRGADAIVANAALYTLKPLPWAAFYKANKEGVENVFDAAHDAGVKRIVHVSTVGVYRPLNLFGRIGEDAARLRLRDRWWFWWAYPVSKALSEEIAWERAAKHGLDLTVVRPAGIFGPRDQEALPQIRFFLRLPFVPVPTFVFPMSHAGDIAKGICGALQNDASVGQAYNLSGEPVSLYRFMKAWAAQLGGRVLPLPVPLGLRFDNSKARAELGFENRPLEEAVRDTLANG